MQDRRPAGPLDKDCEVTYVEMIGRRRRDKEMHHSFASVALLALVSVAAAQTTPPAPDHLTEAPKPGEQLAPAAGGSPPVSETPIVSSPPSPEARTPANPLQPPAAVEGSPPPASADVPPLPAPPAPRTPLQR